MAKVKGKERILKPEREKQRISYKGTPTGYQLTSLKKHHRPEGSGKIYSKPWKGKNFQPRIFYPRLSCCLAKKQKQKKNYLVVLAKTKKNTAILTYSKRNIERSFLSRKEARNYRK